MSPQLSIRNPDADMMTRGQRVKKDSTPYFRSGHRSTRGWGDLVGDSPTHEGCDNFIYGTVRYI